MLLAVALTSPVVTSATSLAVLSPVIFVIVRLVAVPSAFYNVTFTVCPSFNFFSAVEASTSKVPVEAVTAYDNSKSAALSPSAVPSPFPAAAFPPSVNLS